MTISKTCHVGSELSLGCDGGARRRHVTAQLRLDSLEPSEGDLVASIGRVGAVRKVALPLEVRLPGWAEWTQWSACTK